jgi:myo-inositol-1(or 4)-monophosphatase
VDIAKDLKRAETAAIGAARSVGTLMRRHLSESKRAHTVTQHDIKLELDVRSQKLIERTLRTAFPNVSLLGEEGVAGKQDSDFRWVVDPIDGTVNFAYGIPHACVSIALQGKTTQKGASVYEDDYQTLVGVVYDPFCDELWTARMCQPARLNGRPIHVSQRNKLSESIIAIGFAKTRKTLEHTLPYFNELVPRVRKIRIMGSAALALTYVATGRFDAYIERGISLWDIAAGGLILQCADGEFWRQPVSADHKYRMIASNGRLRQTLRVPD